MKKTKLAKAIAFAITGAALTAGSVSTASATSTTMYNLYHDNSGAPCAPCSPGTTDGWVWGGVGDSIPSGTDTIQTSNPTINGAPGAGWVGTTATDKTPFGYTGGGSLNWAVELTGGQGGVAEVSNADSITRYGISADIDTAKGAWSDNITASTNTPPQVASGWRHDTDFGLFKSDVDGEVTLNAVAIHDPSSTPTQTPNIGFTIFEGVDTSTTSYNHHGAWNSTNNENGLTQASVPGGNTNHTVSSIVAYSVGGATPKNLNQIKFIAKKGVVYTIALGGYRNGDWTTTTDGYKVSVSQVPGPVIPPETSVDVPAPSPNLSGTAPKLFPSEQGAFKALEAATQIVESRIVQKGCTAASYPFEVHTSFNGSGTAVLGASPNEVSLAIGFVKSGANDGRVYSVSGQGTLENGLSVKSVAGTGSFNIGSTIQVLNTSWNITSPQTKTQDNFSGSIIKDYFRLEDQQAIPAGFSDAGTLVDTVIDYGYQSVSKKGFVKAKWWQQSRTWREDGVNAGTHWLKTRVAPTGCAIEVRLEGNGTPPADSIDGFNEVGTIAILGVTPEQVGPFKK